MYIPPSTVIIKARIAYEIQIGDSTHHHDHVIVSVSFSIINTMASKPVNDILFDDIVGFINALLVGYADVILIMLATDFRLLTLL